MGNELDGGVGHVVAVNSIVGQDVVAADGAAQDGVLFFIGESGVPAAGSAGVTYVGVSNSAAVYTVGSGNYLFTSPFSVPAPPVPSTVVITTINQTETGFVMNVGGLVVGRNGMLQSTTNLASGVWTTETNFLATQPMVVFTNSTIAAVQKFFRVVAY